MSDAVRREGLPGPAEGEGPSGAGRPTRSAAADLWEPKVAPWRRSLDRAASAWLDAVVDLVLARWALLLSLGSALVVVGAYLTPLLMHLGYSDLGRALFAAYSYVCAQTPEHSYFLWGYQAAIDQRLTALYGSAALAGLVYYRSYVHGRRVRPIGWRLYLLFCLPIALDGFTQMLGWRQSSWELRTITGALFGVATVWLLFPYLGGAAAGISTGPTERAHEPTSLGTDPDERTGG